jgi:hypothetical protein
MMYKFKSAASGDLIMLGPHGDHMLKLLGRVPSAKGIFEPTDMAGLITTLEAAIQADAQEPADPAAAAKDDQTKPTVGLRQRLWPMIDMLRRCLAAREPIVWGV